MTRYIITGSDGEESFNRKHTWLPCIISADIGNMTTQEQAAVFRATWWSDNITNSEWPALLRHEGASRSARSKLKRKAVGWFMAIGRIAAIDPEFYDAIVKEAKRLYLEQLREPHPCFRHSETPD